MTNFRMTDFRMKPGKVRENQNVPNNKGKTRPILYFIKGVSYR